MRIGKSLSHGLHRETTTDNVAGIDGSGYMGNSFKICSTQQRRIRIRTTELKNFKSQGNRNKR